MTTKALLSRCAHPSCSKMKDRRMYACRYHWRSLPKKIRDAVWAGYSSSVSAWADADREAMAYWRSKGSV